MVHEITRKVTEIQNAGLGEHRIRDLNDEINKLFREKAQWERRIVELGGPDYSRAGGRALDADGKELPGSGGYKYFGAARELPGVRELFAEEGRRKKKRTRGQIFQHISPDYFGWRDEEDGVLVREEAAAESKARAIAVTEWHLREKERAKGGAAGGGGGGGVSVRPAVAVDADERGEGTGSSGAEEGLDAVPSTEAIAREVLERKKRALRAKLEEARAEEGEE